MIYVLIFIGVFFLLLRVFGTKPINKNKRLDEFEDETIDSNEDDDLSLEVEQDSKDSSSNQLSNEKSYTSNQAIIKPMKNQKGISDKKQVNGMKIGEFVRHCFRDAFDQNLIKVDEIKRLQDRAYSKNVFKTSDEILRFKNLSVNDENGYPRYYKRELFCNDYHLYSQWYDEQWDHLLKWLRVIGYNYNKNQKFTSEEKLSNPKENINIKNSKSIIIGKTRFFVDEVLYKELLRRPECDLIININPVKGKHPKGQYVIPNKIAIEFINSKRGAYNWGKNKTFHQDGIPKLLAKYFKYK